MSRKKVAQWFELHGPGLKLAGIYWRYDFDTDRYIFLKPIEGTDGALAVERTGRELEDGSTDIAIQIIKQLSGDGK